MDGFPVTFTGAVCFGASLAFSSLFYYLYKKSQTTINKLENAPHFTVDEKLKELLKVIPGSSLQYAVIEGTVRSENELLASSFHKEIFGVLQKFTLKEHRLVWSSVSRTWLDAEQILHQKVNMSPFLLVGLDKTSVRVLNPLEAAGKYTEVIYEKFTPANYGFGDLVGQFVSGVKTKGHMEIEEMLKVGTTLTAVGEIRLNADGTLSLRPPSDGSQYFLSMTDFDTLRMENLSVAFWWKALAIASALAGVTILLWAALRYYRYLKNVWEQEREAREFARFRSEIARLRANEARAEAAAGGGNGNPENVCVICLDQPRDCILLNCGHMCCCHDCFLSLRQRQCPICRQDIVRVVPIYQP